MQWHPIGSKRSLRELNFRNFKVQGTFAFAFLKNHNEVFFACLAQSVKQSGLILKMVHEVLSGRPKVFFGFIGLGHS